MQIVVKTLFGLEELLAKEIEAIGGKNIEILSRAVRFEGGKKELYRANIECRTALRVLVHFHEFKTKHENHFYKRIKEIDWSQFLNLHQTFAVDAVTQSKYMNHSKYLALKTKDAIVDQFRETNEERQRPSIDLKNPHFRINIHLSVNNLCTVSFDSSGDILYKRGYRESVGDAPLNEILAAGLVMLSGWKGDCDLVDSMCGSGTIPIEAAMIARNIPPNLNREEFGFQKWKDFDADLLKEVKEEATARIKDFNHNIYGFDRDYGAIKMANRNAMNAGLAGDIVFEKRFFEEVQPESEKGMLIMNPPYDERLEIRDIVDFYKSIGDALKQNWKGWEGWLISSNLPALKRVGLRPSRKILLFNGKLECKFQKYEMYAGTKKIHKLTKNNDT